MKTTKTANSDMIEKAIEETGWRWLRDQEGAYHVHMKADAEFGDIETEYWLLFKPEFDNAFIFRLYGNPWFAGVPSALLEACNKWNATTALPKAALIVDEPGDSKLVLEHVISCWDEEIPQALVTKWLQDFSRGCSTFLADVAETLCEATRYVACAASEPVH